ncbi:MAG: ATP-dependent metallopeptidase FtsH/Yme1/Tma family protein [Firmicutes bacterium]|nr:ATP-dependent metallopeptidase FtsH/Yme1/Tma family protein [Bacillota bacterium]
MVSRIFKNLAIYLLIVLIAVSAFRWTAEPDKSPKTIDYKTFYQYVETDKVKSVQIVLEDNVAHISAVLKNNDEKIQSEGPQDQSLVTLLREKNVESNFKGPTQPPWWTSLLSTFLPILLLIGFVFFMMQQTQGGGSRVMQFGKSRARLHTDEKKRVTFEDVAGADEAKEELQEVVEFLKQPKKFTEMGARIPKGVLLFGAPGTGKTLLARAVAGEAGVPFFSISGSDFVEMFVGVGASRVRDLFDQAKKNSPCIVFIDEIDAVGRHRGAGLGGGHDEREQTLNQLLVEMDGFSANEGIIVVAATNRPDILDPALLRPGRFDRHITVDRPDVVGRKAILKVHSKDKPLDNNIDLEVLARRTPGFTGADIANMMNEAALLAARRGKNRIAMDDLEAAIERVIAGPEKKSRVISDQEKQLVAYHEAGHAVVGAVLPNTDPVHKISIIPRGRAGGYTLLLPTEDRYYATRSRLLDEVTVLLGGRVAESLVLKEISTGAQNDLERATLLVRKMITEFGMSDELGPITYGHKQEQVFLGRDISRDRNYSEAVAQSIDRESRKLIDDCYHKAENILTENMHKLELVAKTLIVKETLEGPEFEELMKSEAEAAPVFGDSGENAESGDKTAESGDKPLTVFKPAVDTVI